MVKKRIYLWILAVLCSLVFVHGQEVGLLVSPGKLSNVHAELTGIKNCDKCHTAGKRTQVIKCLNCHKDLAQRISGNQGFHRNKKQNCPSCHPEHLGRKFKLIDWDIKKFDHDQTGYPLTGLHTRVNDCKKCHSAKNSLIRKLSDTYLLKSRECSACHTDIHKGSLGNSCDKCHPTSTQFKDTASGFNHSQTRYPLTGKHKTVVCSKCHINKRWRGLKHSDCNSCHKNPHNPPLQQKCSSCHRESSWKVSVFDHNLTRYPLKGKHRKLTCRQCHPPAAKNRKIPYTNCKDCHRQDPHQGQFSKDCRSCHTVFGFKPATFNHADSRYPLTGKHKGVACGKCHRSHGKGKTVVYKPLTTSCSDCHKDIHLGQLTKACQNCHKTENFKLIEFDHQQDSRYPLIGKHQQVKCAKCHPEKQMAFPASYGRAKLYRPLATTCSSCHKDIHRAQYGQDCRLCHDFISFKQVKKFDHENTKFPLVPFHSKVTCQKCHVQSGAADQSTAQRITQRKKNTLQCLECHLDYDHSGAVFPLTGKHKGLECKLCHSLKQPNFSKYNRLMQVHISCEKCHVSPHPGDLGECGKCHTSQTWRVDSW